MVADKKTRQYTNRLCSFIVRIWKWAASHELVSYQVYERLSLVEPLQKRRTTAPETKGEFQPIPLDDILKTIPHLSPMIASMVLVQLSTAMRPSEVRRMKPKYIDRNGPDGTWVYNLSAYKGDHWEEKLTQDTVILGPKAQEVLTPWLEDTPLDNFLFSSDAVNAFNPRTIAIAEKALGKSLGATRQNKPISIEVYRNSIVTACKKADVPRWSPQRLRHTMGTEIRKQFGLDHSQAVLRHTRSDTTERYAKVLLEKSVEVMRKIG